MKAKNKIGEIKQCKEKKYNFCLNITGSMNASIPHRNVVKDFETMMDALRKTLNSEKIFGIIKVDGAIKKVK